MTLAIVCGLGPSIEGFSRPPGVTIWGVNDVARHVAPDHLVLLDGPDRFHRHARRPDALEVILQTRPRYVWVSRKKYNPEVHGVWWQGKSPSTPAMWGRCWPDAEMMLCDVAAVGQRAPLRFDSVTVPIFHISPFAAAYLAVRFTHHRVGLLGVDMVGHPDEPLAGDISLQFGRLALAALATYGTDLVNLSPISKITSLPRMTLR